MRPDPSLSKGLLSFAVATALVLTAGACATSPAEKSAAGEAAGATAKAEEEKGKRKKPWWRLSQYSRDTGLKPIEPDGMRPGPGLFSGKEGGFVLYRKSDLPSSDPSKPTKVKR